ncbi:hypothetical protein Tsubulata_018281 [Turnera subulata]|uniref:Leucine-rich repeat-containing N-terminal plant-type domain-containing protein n=1 Tax=Turnera subulata TaxID=218843 RepID=A0A9Q0G8H2_9ROSI|nr:hypothetical protein Tsubulata_018281 [Turnera subulata]
MRPVLEWIVLIVFLLVSNCCYGCLKEERNALLQIKAWINHPNGKSLSGWVDNDEDADCCKWRRVECHTTTKRVIKLSLGWIRHWKRGDLYLNTSLFLSLKELRNLNLSFNQLVCCMQGTGALSSELRNLEVLNLNDNNLNDSVLSLLRGASSLRSLKIAGNSLTGMVHINDLGSLSNLEKLDLSDNLGLKNFISPRDVIGLRMLKSLHLDFTEIDGSTLLKLVASLPSLQTLSLEGLSQVAEVPPEFYNLTNLEELFLDGTTLPRSILLNIGALSSLKIVSLRGCTLNGTLPDVGWCELRKLEQLYLSTNELVGELPACLRNLSSLIVMDLSYNQFKGNIASSPLVDLTSLQYVSFSYNQFRVPASFASFSNHSNLKLISCDNNELSPEPNLQTSSAPVFQLNYFSMSNCTSETGKAEYPYFLYFQYDLRLVDLSHNNFGGPFPSWLVENNTMLKQLYLKNNSLEGPLQLNYPASNLTTFDISTNYMHGQTLKTICSSFPNLVNLMIAGNGLTGGIPQGFENMTNLAYLDMSNNEVSSSLFELLPSFGSSLWYLKLSNNNLEGRMSPAFFNQTRFEYLYLDNNNFSGQIPNSLSKKVFPILLDMSNNHFSGMLPGWLGNLSEVQVIDFSKNHFQGSIPGEICILAGLQFFDLSENNLSGSIPSCTNLPEISHVHLYHNQLSGPLTYAFFNSSSLVTLDLRGNKLTGRIPNWINTLSKLSILLLKGNNFDGDLPVELCLLTQLSILDLSLNMFSGRLPSCLRNINSTAIWTKNQFPSPGQSFDVPEDSWLSIGGLKLPQQGVNLIERMMLPVISVEEVIEFTTKKTYYTYKDSILNYMSGVDLSCNRFTGEIPKEIGNMRGLRALNLSHNNLTGAIPSTFSNLEQIESLDLSHNDLTGAIPQRLIELYSLAVFSVADNNLSGKTPEMKDQFATFDQTSYEGNPLLCGPPLQNSCTEISQPPSVADDSTDGLEHDGFMDMGGFYISFGLAYTTVVVTLATVLCINPHWRRVWFYFIEMFITTCYYFLVDSFLKLYQLLSGGRN